MLQTKAELRRSIREALKHCPDRQLQSEMICERLQNLLPLMEAKCVAAFVPLPLEADVLPLLRRFLSEGRRVGLPRCREKGCMDMHEVHAESELKPGAYGIPEPAAASPIIPPEAFDAVLVPLMACDLSGNRLGKGGGYYDRWLPHSGALRIGVALREQIADEIPCEETDCRLDILVTPDKTYVFGA